MTARIENRAVAEGDTWPSPIRQGCSRTSHFFRHILHFWLAIVDVQHGFLLVHVQARLKCQPRNHGSIDIHKTHGRMVRE